MYNVDKPLKYYAKWRKPVTKNPILYGMIPFNEMPRIDKSRDRKQTNGWLGLMVEEVEGNGEWLIVNSGFLLWADKNDPKLIVAMAAQFCAYTKTTELYTV